MKRAHLLLFASALLDAIGCPTRSKYDQMPTVAITSPTTDKYTNGTVSITARSEPDLGLPIVLRRGDGIVLETLMPPNDSFDWDTTPIPEGTYTVLAEVTFSNETARSLPVTIIVDRKPPTITVTPAPGAGDVALREPIRALFSEPVVFSPALASTFAVSADGMMVPATATLDADSRGVTIALDNLASLALPTLISISIGPGISDRAGNALAAVGNWSWVVPEWRILPTVRSNSPPALTLGIDRLPVIGFAVPGSMGVSAVGVARYDGSGWIQSQPASTFGDLASAGISVAVDSHDDVLLAWSDYGIGSRFIAVRRWDGTNWNEGIAVLDGIAGSATDATSPVMRMDRTDHPVVSWIENGDVFAARWTGTAWDSSWGSLGLSLATANDVVLDSQDNPVIAWRLQGADQGLSTWAGKWTTDSLPSSVQPPTVAIDASRFGMSAIASNQSIRVLRVANRQALDATDPLMVTIKDQNPRLVVDPAGRPAVAWLRTAARRLGFARWTGSQWDTRAGQFDDGTLSLAETTAPQIVADSFGTVWIAWWESGLVNVRMTNY